MTSDPAVMGTEVPDAPPASEGTRPRRSILMSAGAALGALVAQGLARPAPASAANGDNVKVGQLNTGTLQTTVRNTAAVNTAVALRGEVTTTGGGGGTAGVWGQSAAQNGSGVFGFTSNNTGTVTKGVYGRSQSSLGRGVYGEASHTTGSNYGVYGESKSSNGTGVYGTGGAYGVRGASTINFGVYGYGGYTGLYGGGGSYGVIASGTATGGHFSGGGTGIAAYAGNSSGTTYGVYASAPIYGVYGLGGNTGVYAKGNGYAGVSATGLYYGVVASGTDSAAYGIYSAGGYLGVYGTGPSYGVYGSSGFRGVAGSGGNTGVYGTSGYVGLWGDATTTSGVNYAVYGKTYSGGGWAGFFDGHVQVNGNVAIFGNLSKTTGSFQIDHPQDPANKYLFHSFVESPDMMNVYNGVATLDASGRTTVKLPGYFEALNKDYRYQLTTIGGYAPVYIASEVRNNEFAIAGGNAGMKVSWQVTGVRQDAYANAHRIQVEVAKTGVEKGKFLTPKEHGRPEAMGISAAQAPKGNGEHPEVPRRLEPEPDAPAPAAPRRPESD